MKYFVEIVAYENEKVVERIPCGSNKGQADKVDRGANINLNHDEYFTRIEEEE